MRRYLIPILMVLSLGFLMGDDCEIEIEDGFWGYPFHDVVYVEPYYDYVVVEPYCCGWW